MKSYEEYFEKGNTEGANLNLKLAIQAVLDYTNRLDILKEMRALVIELALYKDNQEDRDGIISRSEGAISETYQDTSNSDGIPAFIRTRLNRYKVLHITKRRDEGL